MARPADPHARFALTSAARAEFVKRGIRGARIEDITAACGLSKGAFYLHFDSKEALFRDVVTALTGELERLTEERIRLVEGLFRDLARSRSRLSAADQAERVERVFCLEVEADERLLELFWDNRDVIEVLISGCQGTEFEGQFWRMVDREVHRVGHNMECLQGLGACRPDVPPELFGSLLVGAYVVVAKQLGKAKAKPDLAAWARSLHRLIHEGASPGHLTHAAPAEGLKAAGGVAARPLRRSGGAIRRNPARSSPRNRS
ncbi:MAG: TetR/AcrR family transcriptional regulator [Myxococcaceae bacterium]|nr:TetR/AcrR family transcriptional regulator [Myxococcaceae bacterium]MCI0670685.1 TetR/AcrR family transcriptional regulator [Myxococcaceae bacterium]